MGLSDIELLKKKALKLWGEYEAENDRDKRTKIMNKLKNMYKRIIRMQKP